MPSGFFVTGTDTDCGKTVVSCALMHALARSGRRVGAFKPVAAGAEATPEGLRNADALALRALARPVAAYELVNPVCFAPAVAPHIAAAEAGRAIEIPYLLGAHRELGAAYEVLVVEGAGGWRVPLDRDLDMSDLAAALGYPVILVVGLRLGCLNHALLTVAGVQAAGLELAGWIGNTPGPVMDRLDENVATLRQRIPAPCLGVVPSLHPPYPAAVAERLLLDPLLERIGGRGDP